MDGFVLFALIVAGLAFFGGLALTSGIDSRPGFGDESLTQTFLS